MYLFCLFYYQQIMYLLCLFYYQQIMYLFSLLSYIRSIARNKMKQHLNSTQYENTMRTGLVRNCIKYFPFGMNEQKQPVTFIDVPVHACTKTGTWGGHVYVCIFVLGYRFLPVLTISLFDFGSVPTVWYLLFLILCQTFLLNMSH